MKDDVIMPGRGPLAELDVGDLRGTPRGRTFEYIDRLGQPAEGFILWHDGRFVAYENRCPHWSVPVGFDDETFLDKSGNIVCPMHGALFNIETGQCWSGPCIGDGLEKFEVSLDGDVATITRKHLKMGLL